MFTRRCTRNLVLSALALGVSGTARAPAQDLVRSVQENLTLLSAEDLGTRLDAVVGLRDLANEHADQFPSGTVEALCAVLRNEEEDARVHFYVTQILGKIGDPACIETLVATLGHPSSLLRASAALLLGETFRATGAATALRALALDPDPEVRAAAARALDALPPLDPAAPEPTVQDTAFRLQSKQVRALLESARPEYRRSGLVQTRLLIQQFGTSRVLDALLPSFQRLLDDPDRDVRREMLVLLQSFGDARLIDPLIEVLQRDPGLRAQALLALPDVPDPRVGKVLVELLQDESPATVSMALERLVKRADASLIPAVVAALRTATHLHVFEAAEQLLTQIGTPAVEPLLEACRNENASVRRVAVKVLGNLGDARALDAILAALEDPDFFVSRNATEALKVLGSEELREEILARLEHADPLVRSRAAEVLGARQVPEAMVALIAGLEDADARVQESSAKALGDLGDAAAAAPLVEALVNPRFRAHAAAARALARFPGSTVEEQIVAALPQAAPRAREFLVAALRQRGAEAQGALLGLLEQADPGLRLEALKALSYQMSPKHGGHRDEQVVERILRFAVEDPDFPAMDQNERIYLLQRLEDSRAVRLLLELARATDGEVPQTLRIALGVRDDPMVARTLIATLGDDEVSLRRAAAYILAFVQSRDAIDPLLQSWKDADPVVRKWAVWSVGQSYDYNRSVLDAAALARRFVHVLLDRGESTDVRVRAAEALGRVKDDASLGPLVQVLKDRSEPTPLRVRAAQTLQGTSYTPALDALHRIKSDRTEPVELREACMTPQEILERYSGKNG